MRALGMLLPLALAGCDVFDEYTVEDGEDVVGLEQFEPQVLVPGYQGLPDAREADAHEATYGGEPEPKWVRLGFPAQDTSRAMAWTWNTDVGTLASQLELGVAGEEETVVHDGFSFTMSEGTEVAYRIHEVKLGTMTPGTTYRYRVGGEGHWSDWHEFTQPGEPGSFSTFRIAIAGDSRGSYEVWGQAVALMDQYDPDLILFSGDMVELGNNVEEWNAWLEASGDTFARIPFVPAIGNHEFLHANYFAIFSLPGNELYYSIDFGSMTVVSLADLLLEDQFLEFEEKPFMERKFAESTADWKFAMHHAPTYSTCTRHGSNERIRGIWEPAFEAGGVDFVLNGHNHIYERSLTIKDGREVGMGEGTMYLVSGGAGAPLYVESEVDWFSDVADPIEHIIVGDVFEDRIEFQTRDFSDALIDSWTVPLK